MRKQLLLPTTLLFSACATMSGGGKGSSAGFQGQEAVKKRTNEIQDAAKVAMDCMKPKPGEPASKGGIFAVTADAAGKLNVQALKWDGPDAMKQCIVDNGNKATISALPGPSVGAMWEFSPPGESGEPQKPPSDFNVKMQPLRETMQAEVVNCGQRFLGVDFPATVDVTYYVYNDGHAYLPTIISSDEKDGGFESCVQEVVTKTNYPKVDVPKPFGITGHFQIGVYGQTHRSGM